jgi:hypothetical protein
MNDQPKNKIYLNLVPNLNKKAGDNQPVFVAPNSPKAPEGKNWKMNVNINNEWYDYAAFDGTDIEGNPTGGYTVILTKKEAQANKQQGSFKAGGFQKKSFANNKSFGNRQY